MLDHKIGYILVVTAANLEDCVCVCACMCVCVCVCVYLTNTATVTCVDLSSFHSNHFTISPLLGTGASQSQT